MNAKYNLKNINWLNSIFLLGSPIVAILGSWYWLATDGWSWSIFALAFIFWVITGLGITMGYHRLFSHRAYKAHPILRALLLIAGGCAVQNSALKWCNDHRVHHGKVDTPEDPYNINEGFFYAHMGWILLKEEIGDYRYSKDLLNDKMVMLQDKYYMPMIIFFSFLLPGIIGHFVADSFLGGFFFAGFARVVFVHHGTFFINSLCHVLGSRPYDRTQTARDSWFTALFTFGEGYHNYHHAFQSDYRNGIRWYHFDPSKWLIFSLQYFGLTSSLKRMKPEDIMAKMIAANVDKATAKDNFATETAQYLLEKSKDLVKKIKGQRGIDNSELLEQLRLLLNQSRYLHT
ncbi:acyl-CoA desaturase [Bacteriovorax sp. DB6_IX]|uniref:acyl-CoA desaturase n=1 Tax=Bacteriovorax sp. DB6_IX TaxID=1353530 RepID=UPI00038A495C|nr:acyl-CoA desaturase [Bacteriovorax sp. DB6_IX]EQC50530.1 stearoyl-CoA 9-desaturase [Bacteriovorax sp. DB6_IX]